ncbi:MAG TPA: CRTAC1 family protein, partial [Candidatus Dormibacteraeota bacterium]|nr:CRTAC1 family protein [Candidatus Dormibacteraeota bacterium]
MKRRDFLRSAGAASLGLGAGVTFASSSLLGAKDSLGLRFTDVTASSGMRFQHNSGAYGGKLLPETLGSGCAFLDY